MLKDLHINASYKLLIVWRKLVYRRLLHNPYLHRLVIYRLIVSAKIVQAITCLINGNNGNTRIYMDNWQEQTSALFAPEITPLSVYGKSSTDARVALDSTDFGSSGKVIFLSHGAFLTQNASSVLSEIALKTDRPFINTLLFRRQIYPHVEQWWKSYSLCFRINLNIIHNDTLLLIDTAKQMLENNDVVLCAPDYFFSTEASFEEAMNSYEKTVTLFMRLAKSKNADVFYTNCCNAATFDNSNSFLTPIKQYDASVVKALFEQELLNNPNEWFFTHNHFRAIEKWRQRKSNHPGIVALTP